MIEDYFILSLRNLIRRKLRSWLTMIGIFIGITALVSLISLGQGLRSSVEDQFSKLGTDKIIITPGSFSSGPPGTSLVKLSNHDLAIIKKVSNVDNAAPMTFRTLNIEFNKRKQSLIVIGMPTDEKEKQILKEARSISILEGRELKNGDSKKVIIGYDLSYNDKLFGKIIKLGDSIIISGKTFKVVGVVDKVGNPLQDKVSYLTIEDDEIISGKKDQYDFIYARTIKNIKPDDVADKIKKDMRHDRNEKEGQESFSVETLQNIGNVFGNILLIVQAVIIGIASISVLVGGVGIMNTMYTSVLERTREIGVMKAIGAKNSDIMIIFLIESGLLGLVGGIIGILLGIGISKSVELIASAALGSSLIKAEFPLYLIIGSLLFSFIIGTLSGALPAYQASKLRPIEALRYE